MRLHWESSVHKKTALQLICLHSHLCLPSTATAWQIGSLSSFIHVLCFSILFTVGPPRISFWWDPLGPARFRV